MIGVPKTPEHRRNISLGLRRLAENGTLPAMQPEIRLKQSLTKRRQYEAGKKATPVLWTPEKRELARVAREGTMISRYGFRYSGQVPDIREKSSVAKSAAMARRVSEGAPTNVGRHYLHGWYESSTSGSQWYDSGWELQRMKTLDAAGILWTKSHGVRVPYTTEGRKRLYIPDFLYIIGDEVAFEEVKGRKGPEWEDKEAAVIQWCEERGFRFVLLDRQSFLALSPDLTLEKFSLTAYKNIPSVEGAASKKSEKAQQLGVKVISIDDVRAMVP